MALVSIEINDGIATVSLNRPEKRNAMSFDLLRELVNVAEKIKKVEISAAWYSRVKHRYLVQGLT